MKNNKSFLKTLSIIILFLVISVVSFSQTVNIIKPLPQLNKKFLVSVHIVLDSSKRVATDDNTIRNSVAKVSSIFSPIGVSFEVCDVSYIDNYSYFGIDTRLINELFIKYGVPGRLNLFVVGGISNGLFTNCGASSLGGITQEKNVGVVIAAGQCASQITIAHELGHFFGLEHTFETVHGADLVKSPNCTALGDGICDTPADPYFFGADLKDFLNGCNFIYPQKDAQGNFYDPDIGNVMGYYESCVCSKFTIGQYKKMADNYLSKPTLW